MSISRHTARSAIMSLPIRQTTARGERRSKKNLFRILKSSFAWTQNRAAAF